MAFANNSQSRLSLGVQSDFTTPQTTLVELPFNTHTLDLTKERVQGNQINPDRMLRVDRHGNRNAVGEVVVDLRGDDYDSLLESAFLGAWDTDILKVGTTPKYFTIEDYASDIDQVRLFTGMTVNTMNISIAPNQMITTTFGFVGYDMEINQTEATPSAATLNAPFDSYSGAYGIADNDSTPVTTANLSSLELTMDNGITPAFVVGDAAAPCLIFGQATVEGTLTVYFENASMINRFLSETETALEVSVADPDSAHQFTFLLPRVKINGAEASVTGTDGARFVTAPFVALYDDEEETNIQLTRTYA